MWYSRQLLAFGVWLACFLNLEGKELSFTVPAESALLINADTGKILYQKDADKRLPPASVIKIATTLYTLEKKGDQLNEIVEAEAESLHTITPFQKKQGKYSAPSYWLETDTKTTGLQVGEHMALKDLLYCHMISSSGDASNIIAQAVSGKIPQFIEEANFYLQGLGCTNTVMTNPHGLHHPQQLTTAKDIAKMLAFGLKNPTFREIISTDTYNRPATNKNKEAVLHQTNKLLRKGKYYYRYTIGGKTGWHSDAKHTFAVAAEKDHRTLIAVLLGCAKRQDIFEISKKMFEEAFAETKMRRTLLPKGAIATPLKLTGAEKPIIALLDQEAVLEYYPSEEPSVQAYVVWDNLALPVLQGEKVGIIQISDSDGALLAQYDLFSKEEVKATWLYTLQTFYQTIANQSLLPLLLLTLAAGGIVISLIRRQRRA